MRVVEGEGLDEVPDPFVAVAETSPVLAACPFALEGVGAGTSRATGVEDEAGRCSVPADLVAVGSPLLLFDGIVVFVRAS